MLKYSPVLLIIWLLCMFLGCRKAPLPLSSIALGTNKTTGNKSTILPKDTIRFELDYSTNDALDPLASITIETKYDSVLTWSSFQKITIPNHNLFKWRHKTASRNKSGIEWWKFEVQTANGTIRRDTFRIFVRANLNYNVLSNIKLSNNYAFFSTKNRITYDTLTAEQNKDSIDISYYFLDGAINIVSPLERTDKAKYGSKSITWGKVALEIKNTNLTPNQYNNILPEDTLSSYFNDVNATLVKTDNFTEGSHLKTTDATKIYAIKIGKRYGLLYPKLIAKKITEASIIEIKIDK